MRSFMLGVFFLAGIVQAQAPATKNVNADVRAVMQRYYGAIDRRDYMTAYAMWHGNKTYDQFRGGYAQTARVRVAVGPAGPITTGQGKMWTIAWVDVRAVLKSGRQQHFRGNFSFSKPLDASPSNGIGWSIDNGCLTPLGKGECV